MTARAAEDKSDGGDRGDGGFFFFGESIEAKALSAWRNNKGAGIHAPLGMCI